MKELEQILDDCIEQILSGASTVEECLKQYPAEAAVLEPLLRVGEQLQGGRWLHVPRAVKNRVRADLKWKIKENPRRAAFSGLGKHPGAKSQAGFS